MARKRSRRRAVRRSSKRHTAFPVARRSRRSRRVGRGFAGGSSFNLKRVLIEGAVGAVGVVGVSMLTGKLAGTFKADTAKKVLLLQLAAGLGVGYVLGKYAKMPWAGAAVALANTAAVGAQFYAQSKAGTSGVRGIGATNWQQTNALQAGPLSTGIPNDPGSRVLALAQ